MTFSLHEDASAVLPALANPLHGIQEYERISPAEQLKIAKPGQIMGLLANHAHGENRSRKKHGLELTLPALKLTSVRMENAKSLLRAIERMMFRLNAHPRWTEAGLEIQAQTPFQSEFLPPGFWSRGFCALPGKQSHEPALAKPHFFLSFGEPAPAERGLRQVSRWTLWEKAVAPEESDWSLERVEDVPSLRAYQSVDPSDPLLGGPLDPFSQWFVAYSQEREIKGKLRLTDAGDNSHFLSQSFTRTEQWGKLWQAAAARAAALGSARLLTVTPKSTDFPASLGFRAVETLVLQIAD